MLNSFHLQLDKQNCELKKVVEVIIKSILLFAMHAEILFVEEGD